MGKYYRGNAGKAGSTPKGGFAKYWRGPSRFAIPIPKEMDPAVAAPLLCGGITTYRPLAQWKAGTERKRVGVIGVGGLGHMGIQFARALGAEVTAISRSDSKKADAEQLGATKFLATGSDVAAACGSAEHARSLDLILCTINPPDFKEITDYLKLLAPQGQFVLLGVPSKPLSIPAFSLIGSESSNTFV
jgi:alcohol dehydrogenase (NADP+)